MANPRMVTDMNDRERERFAGALEQVAEAATKSVAALREGDDTALVPQIMALMLQMLVMQDLVKVLQAVQIVDVEDLNRPMEE